MAFEVSIQIKTAFCLISLLKQLNLATQILLILTNVTLIVNAIIRVNRNHMVGRFTQTTFSTTIKNFINLLTITNLFRN